MNLEEFVLQKCVQFMFLNPSLVAVM